MMPMDPRLLQLLAQRGLGMQQQMQPPQPQIDPNPSGFNPEMLRAQMPIPNPKGVGSAYDRAGLGMTNLLGKVGAGLFPTDPQAAQHMPAEQMKGMQSQALMNMGLGMMANARKGLGPALAQGYFGARDQQLGEQKQSFAMGSANRQEDLRNQQYADLTSRDARDYDARRGDEMWQRGISERGMALRERELNEYKLGRIAALREQQGAGRFDEDDPTLDMAAEDFLRDKTSMRNYASWGQAGTPARKQIAQRANKLLSEKYHMSPEQLESIRANVKGQTRNVQQMTTSVQGLQAFDTVAKNNGAKALELFKKVSDTGVPLLNAWTRGTEYGLGSADMAELRQVLQNYAAETGRIIAGHPQLLGATTDTARAEISHIMSGDMTVAQAQRVLERLQFEVDLRLKGFQQSLTESSNSMSGLGLPGQAFPRTNLGNPQAIGGGQLPNGTQMDIMPPGSGQTIDWRDLNQ